MLSKLKIILAIIGFFLAIQFIPVGGRAENPPVASEPKWQNNETRELFYRACGDCHSHETRWPWYSRIAPVSWLIRHHVNDGRRHFNVSLWGLQKKNKGHDAAQELEQGSMPPASYLWLHSEAHLSEDEKQRLVRGLLATFPEEKERWVE